ncbi:MAG: hypothetical protein P1V97_11910 [Planctomycetota bacterium]|nr:hypothetical protein [Planctomycetota bacterium]
MSPAPISFLPSIMRHVTPPFVIVTLFLIAAKLPSNQPKPSSHPAQRSSQALKQKSPSIEATRPGERSFAFVPISRSLVWTTKHRPSPTKHAVTAAPQLSNRDLRLAHEKSHRPRPPFKKRPGSPTQKLGINDR